MGASLLALAKSIYFHYFCSYRNKTKCKRTVKKKKGKTKLK